MEEQAQQTQIGMDTGTGESQSKTSEFLNLEQLIKNHAESIERLKDELKAKREMYEDTFNNNPTYREHLEKVKEATKNKSSIKFELSKQPSVVQLKQKIDDLKFDINEQSKTMGDLLMDFTEQTGATQIELFDRQYFIVKSAKLHSKNPRS